MGLNTQELLEIKEQKCSKIQFKQVFGKLSKYQQHGHVLAKALQNEKELQREKRRGTFILVQGPISL